MLQFVYEESKIFIDEDEYSSWHNKVGDFMLSIWDRRNEICIECITV